MEFLHRTFQDRHIADSIKGVTTESYLGPGFTDSEIESQLKAFGALCERLDDPQLLPELAGDD